MPGSPQYFLKRSCRSSSVTVRHSNLHLSPQRSLISRDEFGAGLTFWPLFRCSFFLFLAHFVGSRFRLNPCFSAASFGLLGPSSISWSLLYSFSFCGSKSLSRSSSQDIVGDEETVFDDDDVDVEDVDDEEVDVGLAGGLTLAEIAQFSLSCGKGNRSSCQSGFRKLMEERTGLDGNNALLFSSASP